jgi:hypothetical protein
LGTTDNTQINSSSNYNNTQLLVNHVAAALIVVAVVGPSYLATICPFFTVPNGGGAWRNWYQWSLLSRHVCPIFHWVRNMAASIMSKESKILQLYHAVQPFLPFYYVICL